MARVRILVVVLAGGAGGRLDLLTRDRAKPAMPFAGTHRLIDFPMSNCRNSHIDDVWISQQFNPISLSEHLSNGRPWDLDRTAGGLLVLQPRLGHDDRTGFQRGTADALWRYAPLIREHRPGVLVVVSADAVYALDYRALAEEHAESGADLTMVTTRVHPEDANRYGVVQAAGSRIRHYAYKPEAPDGDLVANEVFAFTPDVLLDALDSLAAGHEEDGLADLGHEVLPRLVDEGEVRAHPLEGYWRDVGTVPAYWEAHQDLLADEPPIDLADPAWPILTRETTRRAPARVSAGAAVRQSLLAPSSRVAGDVERSVIGRGAVVEAGAVVRDAVILEGVVVRAGAHVERAVLDDGVEVGAGARVGGPGEEVALVGLRARVAPGDEVEPGGRHPVVED